jgi:hypothetical protein
MPKSKIPAAGGALPAKGRPDLTDIVDQIDTIRNLVEAAYMAAADIMAAEQRSPIRTVLHLAGEKLTAARDALNAREAAHAEVL